MADTAHELSESSQTLTTLNRNMTEALTFTTVFVGTEAVLGFLGNALVLYVFLFRYRYCNFRYFVLCLAFIDILSTLTTLPGEVFTQLNWYIYPNECLCKAKSFFNVFTVTAEAMCLMTISVDRYRKVCHPHKWQLKPHIAMRLCAVIYCIAFVLALPVVKLWGIDTQNKTIGIGRINVSELICLTDQKYDHKKEPLMYTIFLIVVCSIFCVTMFVLYVYVARRLLTNKIIKRRISRIQAKLNNSTSEGSLTYSQQGELETAKISENRSNYKMTEIEPSLLRSSRLDCDKDTRQPHRSDFGRLSTRLDQENRSESEANGSKSINKSNHNEAQDNKLCKVKFAKVSKPPSNDKMTEIEPSLLRSSRWDCDEDTQQTHMSDSGRSSTGSDQEKRNEAERNDSKPINMSNRNENQDNELCLTEVEVKVGDEKNESTEPTSPVKNGVVRPRLKEDINTRVRRKTLIMLILTVIFILTTATYLTLLAIIAEGTLFEGLKSDGERAVYFFFFRLVFINHVINPVVYGILDPQFRSIIRKSASRLSCFGVNQSQK